MKKLLFILLAAVISGQLASAQVAVSPATSPTPAAKSAEAERVVVSAGAIEHSETDTVESVSVLNGVDLKQQNVATLGDALANEPGVAASGFSPGATFSGNTSGANGGTLYNFGGATAKALNTIFYHTGSGLTIRNSSGGMFTSLGHNLSNQTEGGDTGTGPGGFLGAAGDKRNTNPMLQLLQDNGGLTNTMAITSSSPAFEAGDDSVLNAPYNLTTDEHGISRKLGAHVDIGAYESELQLSGTTFTVNSIKERDDGTCGALDCTLPEAPNAANANPDANVITFPPNFTGSYVNHETSGLSISHPVTIIGPGTTKLILEGFAVEAPIASRPDGTEYDGQIFRVESGAGNVAISDMTLAFGKAIRDYPDDCGGAILNNASLTLTRCTFELNSADLLGGVVYNNGSSGNATLTMTDCLLTGNSAQSGGALFNADYTGHATMNLTNCTVNGNRATQYGGGIYSDGTVSGNAALTLTNCTFNNNSSASGVGGNINIDGSNPDSSGVSTLVVRNNIFKKAAGGAANLFNDGGTYYFAGP